MAADRPRAARRGAPCWRSCHRGQRELEIAGEFRMAWRQTRFRPRQSDNKASSGERVCKVVITAVRNCEPMPEDHHWESASVDRRRSRT